MCKIRLRRICDQTFISEFFLLEISFFAGMIARHTNTHYHKHNIVGQNYLLIQIKSRISRWNHCFRYSTHLKPWPMEHTPKTRAMYLQITIRTGNNIFITFFQSLFHDDISCSFCGTPSQSYF